MDIVRRKARIRREVWRGRQGKEGRNREKGRKVKEERH